MTGTTELPAAEPGLLGPAAGDTHDGHPAALPRVDDPAVVAEVRAVFDRYEQALREADVATLTELFWDDPRCVRYGVADRQQGGPEIAAWRRAHPGVPAGRTLSETVVLAVDERCAVVSTLFGYPGSAAEGRQTQTWVRFPDGWRIAAAHVSEVGP